ncbi:MAG: ATP-binding protein, partial [Pseudomonas sp.]
VGLGNKDHWQQESRKSLDSLQRTYPYYAWIGATDRQGTVLAATNGVLENADVSARPWFKNIEKDIHVGDLHEAKLLARLLPNATDEPLRFVDIAFAYVGPDNKAQGVLGAHLYWEWAKDIQKSIIEPVARERRVDALIVSTDNKVLLGTSDLQGKTLNLHSLEDAKRGRSGFTVETWPDGREYLVGFSQGTGYGAYPGLGWKTLVRQELGEAYLPVKQLQWRVLGSGIAIASLFSLLGLCAARVITRPLGELSRAAKKLEAGHPAEIDEVNAAYTEVRTLSGSLNSLIRNLLGKEADLKELNLTLENRVKERTLELTQALASVRENENRINTIVETAQGAFIGVDFQGRITDWNSQAHKMLGWTREEIIGKSLNTLVPVRFHASIEQALRLFTSTGAAAFTNTNLERLVLTRDGRELPVEIRIGLINDGKLQLFSAFLHDISDRKQVERMKNEFISTASHELRTPLAAIYASLDMLYSGMGGDLPPDVRELLGISHKSAERLVRLVNDVLDVEKIESRSMTYHMVAQPLLPLVEQAMSTTQTYADQYQVRFELEPDSPTALVEVDADRLIQVVVNLLSNAAKFSPSGGAVVRIRLQRRDSAVRLSVIDGGNGIPPEFRDRVFQRFAQVDSSDRRQKGGTGLGLSICKSIVEQHRGTIDFVSEPGQGCEFYFELPLAPQA